VIKQIQPDLLAAKRADSNTVLYRLSHERTVRNRVTIPPIIAAMSNPTE
jgi:hypothetical protein